MLTQIKKLLQCITFSLSYIKKNKKLFLYHKCNVLKLIARANFQPKTFILIKLELFSRRKKQNKEAEVQGSCQYEKEKGTTKKTKINLKMPAMLFEIIEGKLTNRKQKKKIRNPHHAYPTINQSFNQGTFYLEHFDLGKQKP